MSAAAPAEATKAKRRPSFGRSKSRAAVNEGDGGDANAGGEEAQQQGGRKQSVMGGALKAAFGGLSRRANSPARQ